MFKKIACLILGVILSVSLISCGGQNKKSEEKKDKQLASTETPTTNTTVQNNNTGTTNTDNTGTATTQNTTVQNPSSQPSTSTNSSSKTTSNQNTGTQKTPTTQPATSKTTTSKNTSTQKTTGKTNSPKPATNDPIMALGKLEFKLEDIEGGSYKSSDIFKENKLTMINIWGTLCTPCIKELPELQELSGELSGKGIGIIGLVGDVSGEESLDDAAAIVKKKKVDFLNLVPDDAIRETLLSKIKGYPVTIFVDSKGNLVGETIIGARNKDEYKSVAEKILGTLK